MRISSILLLLFIIMVADSCGTSSHQEQEPPATAVWADSSGIKRQDTLVSDETDISVYHIVVADTGLNYALLRHKMLALSRNVAQEIDTMNRHYDPSKKMIVLPADDNDEIYAGEYFPRRFPSAYLSLEHPMYLGLNCTDKCIGLVAGIYSSRSSADSAVTRLRKHMPDAFAYTARIYTGCLH